MPIDPDEIARPVAKDDQDRCRVLGALRGLGRRYQGDGPHEAARGVPVDRAAAAVDGDAQHRRPGPAEPAGRDADGAQPAGEPGPRHDLRGHRAEPLPRDGAAHSSTTRRGPPRSTRRRTPSPTNLADIRTYASAERDRPSSTTSRRRTSRFAASSDERHRAVRRRARSRRPSKLHIDQEHTISHELEDSLNTLIADSQQLVVAETDVLRVAPAVPHDRRGDLLGREPARSR